MKNSSAIFLMILVFMVCLCLIGCQPDNDGEDSDKVPPFVEGDGDGGDDDDDSGDDDDDVPECDPTLRPLVFLHGWLENGDAFSTQTMRFASNGHCMQDIHAFDWNTMGDNQDAVALLENYIDGILAESSADQIELLGHSAGCGLAYDYMETKENVDKVAHYAHVAGYDWGQPPHNVPTLHLSSEGDQVFGAYDLPGAENIVLEGQDHLQLTTSAESFEHMYRFFHDGDNPETTDILPESSIVLSGRAMIIGLNIPVEGIEIRVFEVDPETGERLTEQPEGIFFADALGYWGDFEARAGAFYEFMCLDPENAWPPLHYYREPFVRSNDKVYFRVFPLPGSLLGPLVSRIVLSDSNAVFGYLNINRAVVLGRDTLEVDGYDLNVPAISAPDLTTLVVVFLDANFNGISEGAPAGGIYESIMFIRFFDLLIKTEPQRAIPLIYNGRLMSVPNWKSRTGGLSIAMFE